MKTSSHGRDKTIMEGVSGHSSKALLGYYFIFRTNSVSRHCYQHRMTAKASVLPCVIYLESGLMGSELTSGTMPKADGAEGWRPCRDTLGKCSDSLPGALRPTEKQTTCVENVSSLIRGSSTLTLGIPKGKQEDFSGTPN